MTTIPPTASKRHFMLRTAVMATGLALCAARVSAQTGGRAPPAPSLAAGRR